MRSRKGMELSMNLIIVAALGILVLILVIFFLSGGLSNFDKAQDCKAHGKCSATCPVTDGDKTYPIASAWGGCQKGEVCCTKIG